MTRLLPCRCGGVPYVETLLGMVFRVVCPECDASVESKLSIGEAIAAWDDEMGVES